MSKCQHWEIWLAKVRFDDDPLLYKRRPVVIVGGDSSTLVSLKLTTQSWHPNSYTVIDWQEAGLTDAAYIRTDKRLQAPDKVFKRKIGRLSKQDVDGLTAILSAGNK